MFIQYFCHPLFIPFLRKVFKYNSASHLYLLKKAAIWGRNSVAKGSVRQRPVKNRHFKTKRLSPLSVLSTGSVIFFCSSWCFGVSLSLWWMRLKKNIVLITGKKKRLLVSVLSGITTERGETFYEHAIIFSRGAAITHCPRRRSVYNNKNQQLLSF